MKMTGLPMVIRERYEIHPRLFNKYFCSVCGKIIFTVFNVDEFLCVLLVTKEDV